jgi:hypothetical protein
MARISLDPNAWKQAAHFLQDARQLGLRILSQHSLGRPTMQSPASTGASSMAPGNTTSAVKESGACSSNPTMECGFSDAL